MESRRTFLRRRGRLPRGGDAKRGRDRVGQGAEWTGRLAARRLPTQANPGRRTAEGRPKVGEARLAWSNTQVAKKSRVVWSAPTVPQTDTGGLGGDPPR